MLHYFTLSDGDGFYDVFKRFLKFFSTVFFYIYAEDSGGILCIYGLVDNVFSKFFSQWGILCTTKSITTHAHSFAHFCETDGEEKSAIVDCLVGMLVFTAACESQLGVKRKQINHVASVVPASKRRVASGKRVLAMRNRGV